MASWSGRKNRLWMNGLDVIRSRFRGLRVEDVSLSSALSLIVHHICVYFADFRPFVGHFRPWLGVEDIPPALGLVMEMTRTRCILWDRKEHVWYLGERVVRQHSSDVFLVPHDPPDSMLDSCLASFGPWAGSLLWWSRGGLERACLHGQVL